MKKFIINQILLFCLMINSPLFGTQVASNKSRLKTAGILLGAVAGAGALAGTIYHVFKKKNSKKPLNNNNLKKKSETLLDQSQENNNQKNTKREETKPNTQKADVQKNLIKTNNSNQQEAPFEQPQQKPKKVKKTDKKTTKQPVINTDNNNQQKTQLGQSQQNNNNQSNTATSYDTSTDTKINNPLDSNPSSNEDSSHRKDVSLDSNSSSNKDLLAREDAPLSLKEIKDYSYNDFLNAIKTKNYGVKKIEDMKKNDMISNLISKEPIIIVSEVDENIPTDSLNLGNQFKLENPEDFKYIPKREGYSTFMYIIAIDDPKHKEKILKFTEEFHSAFVFSKMNNLQSYVFAYSNGTFEFLTSETFSKYDNISDVLKNYTIKQAIKTSIYKKKSQRDEQTIKEAIEKLTEEINSEDLENLTNEKIVPLKSKKDSIKNVILKFKNDFPDSIFKQKTTEWETKINDIYKPIEEKYSLLNRPKSIDSIKDLPYDEFIKKIKNENFNVKLISDDDKRLKISDLMEKPIIHCLEIEEKKYDLLDNIKLGNFFSLANALDVTKIPKRSGFHLFLTIIFKDNASNKTDIKNFINTNGGTPNTSYSFYCYRHHFAYIDNTIIFLGLDQLSPYNSMYDDYSNKFIQSGTSVENLLKTKINKIVAEKKRPEELKEEIEKAANAKKLDDEEYKEILEYEMEMPEKLTEIKQYLDNPLSFLKEIDKKLTDEKVNEQDARTWLINLMLFIFPYTEFKNPRQYIIENNKEGLGEYIVTRDMNALYNFLKDKNKIENFFNRLQSENIIADSDRLNHIRRRNIFYQLHFDQPDNIIIGGAKDIIDEYIKKKNLSIPEDRRIKLELAKKNQSQYDTLLESYKMFDIGERGDGVQGIYNKITEMLFLYQEDRDEIEKEVKKYKEQRYKLSVIKKMLLAFKIIVKLYLSCDKDVNKFFKKVPMQKCIGFRITALEAMRISAESLPLVINGFNAETYFTSFMTNVLKTRKNEKQNNTQFKNAFSELFYKKIKTMKKVGNNLDFSSKFSNIKITEQDGNFTLTVIPTDGYNKKYTIGNINSNDPSEIEKVKRNIKSIFDTFYKQIIDETFSNFFKVNKFKKEDGSNNYNLVAQMNNAFNFLYREWIFDNNSSKSIQKAANNEKIENSLNDPKEILRKMAKTLYDELKNINEYKNDFFIFNNPELTISELSDFLTNPQPPPTISPTGEFIYQEREVDPENEKNVNFKIKSNEDVFLMLNEFYERLILDKKPSDIVKTDEF